MDEQTNDENIKVNYMIFNKIKEKNKNNGIMIQL